jgi:hypothetical protein
VFAVFESMAAGEATSFCRETKALAEGGTIDKASVRHAHGCDAAKISNGAGIVGIESCYEKSAVIRSKIYSIELLGMRCVYERLWARGC